MLDEKKTSRRAIALKYNRESDTAPRVAAKGRGYVADKILEIAEKFNIPVKEDRDLIEILYKLDIEQEIPSELYVVVAEILAFVYKVNQKLASKSSPDSF
ncbi:EscU/YscU/HrcU family type III secretion system export apparatus switch protein [Thermodesulfobacteriota bacterium]